MPINKYLVYFDILGFEELAKQETRRGFLTSEEVRYNLVRRIQDKISTLEKNREIEKCEKQSSDSWLLFTDGIWKALRSVIQILSTKVPLEIAIGVKEMATAPTPSDLTSLRTETISFLKEDVLNPFKLWYRKKYKRSIKRSFCVITNSLYKALGNNDKRMFQLLKYQGHYLIVAPIERIKRRIELHKFLEQIGHKDSTIYGAIDEIYITPEGYETIKGELENKRVVFITGTPEYGKTYTSVRLLWEYYNKGYSPKNRMVHHMTPYTHLL